MHIGQLFGSYREVLEYLKVFEEENCCHFATRDSRKIVSMRHNPPCELKPELEFYEVKFKCIRGGTFRSQGTGLRKSSTIKNNCPAYILLRAHPDGNHLQIRNLNLSHNHELSGIDARKRVARGGQNEISELETTTAVDRIQPTLIPYAQLQPTQKAPVTENPLKRKNFADSSSAFQQKRLHQNVFIPANLPMEDPSIFIGQNVEIPSKKSFQVGQLFSSYRELTEHMKAFEEENFVCFVIRFCKKVESCGYKVEKLNLELEFSSVKFSCIRGGRKTKRGLSKRRNRTHVKTDCPAYISLSITKDGSHLKVISLNLSHNHKMSEADSRGHLDQSEISELEISTAVEDIQPTLIQDASKQKAVNSLNVQVQPTAKSPVKTYPMKIIYIANPSNTVGQKSLSKPITLQTKDPSTTTGQKKLDNQQPVIYRILKEPKKLAHNPVVIQKEDECDVIAKYLALQLRELPLMDMLDAKDEMQQILTKYRKKVVCSRNLVAEEMAPADVSNINKEVPLE